MSSCHTRLLIVAITTLCFLSACEGNKHQQIRQINEDEKKEFLNEDFFLQRTYPDNQFAYKAYESALQNSLANKKSFSTARQGASHSWQLEGPTNIGGRINTLAVHPINQNIIYAGSSNGGIFKTTDGGNSWMPVFDEQPFLTISDIEIDPLHPDTVYAGTGDHNISGYPFIGDGIYKSIDGGQTWSNIGLADTRIVSKIIVHPVNTNIIYAACMGLPFERNNERGLYKSSNGGLTWNKILFLSDSTGVIDVVVHPTDTNIIYAAGWDRIRNNYETLTYGLGAKIYKTTNGGNNWTMLTNGLPLDTLSRIGLEIVAGYPNILYAEIIDTSFELRGIYKTVDAGNTWNPISISGLEDIMGGFGWYFGKIKVNPFSPDEIYVLGIDLWRTYDGGNSWEQAAPDWFTYDVHADKHDLVFLDASTMLLATDGGAYRTDDSGLSWTDIENIPNTQFYHVRVNPYDPGIYWGGAQDNGTARGNAAGLDSWERVLGGDGFNVEFSIFNNSIVYAETQNGNIYVSNDGGFNFDDATDGIDIADRRNWDMPYVCSRHQADVLYTGTFRIYKSDVGHYPYWSAISNDLTDGIIFNPDYFHNITTIAESPANGNILYAGTSDGNLWRTLNGGVNWNNISAGLPDRYVTDIKASFNNDTVVFVSHSGYRDNDFIPHIHVSHDNGDTWTDISGNLPQLAINDIEVYAGNDSTLFVATDGGIYYSTDMGSYWEMLGDNLPILPVFDIEIDAYTKKLIAGTFARSIYSIAIDSFLTPFQITANAGDDKTICRGESAVLNAFGGTNYSWSPVTGLSCSQCNSPTASPAVTTTYTVTVSDAFGNSATDNVMVTVNPAPTKPVIQNEADSLYTDIGASGYQWYRNGFLLTGATDNYFIAQQNGNYKVIVFNALGCSSTSNDFPFALSGIGPLAASAISVYPNPFSGLIQFSAVAGIKEVFVYDASGRKLFSTDKIYADGSIDLSSLKNGLYILEIIAEEGKMLRKIVKE